MAGAAAGAMAAANLRKQATQSNLDATFQCAASTAPQPQSPLQAEAQALAQGKKKKEPILFTKNPRGYIYATLDDPSFSALAKVWSIFMIVLILVSTICFILESETEDGALLGKDDRVQDVSKRVFEVVEWISVVIFTIEYCLRLFTVPLSELKGFILSFQNTVDLIAWLPFWIILGVSSDGDVSGLGFVRAIRLVRVFRVFKVGRYSTGIQMFTGALRNSTQALLILVGGVIISTVIVSSMMYLVEAPENLSDENLDIVYNVTGMGDMQFFCYGTIPNACWWAITTITTVGYGDCYPSTLIGKIIAMFTMLMGVVIIALPITVVGSNFARMCEMYEEETLAFAMQSLEQGEDGLDELQLREFLAFQKKEGLLRRDVDVRIQFLMEKYDPAETGKISKESFEQLKAYVLRTDSNSDAMVVLDSVSKQCSSTEKTVEVLQAQLTSLEASQAARFAELEKLVRQIAARVDPTMPLPTPLPSSGGIDDARV